MKLFKQIFWQEGVHTVSTSTNNVWLKNTHTPKQIDQNLTAPSTEILLHQAFGIIIYHTHIHTK